MDTTVGNRAESRRVIRLRNNSRFADNLRIVEPTALDFELQHPAIKPTFPQPLPSYLPRSLPAPSSDRKNRCLTTATDGLFTMPMKGIRKELRARPRARELVEAIETELASWLESIQVIQNSRLDGNNLNEGRAILSGIVELTRTPYLLKWNIDNDPFARYVVHCCSRYHGVVSYSRDINGKRLTFLIHPRSNNSHQLPIAETPPVTEYDSESAWEGVSENAADDEISSLPFNKTPLDTSTIEVRGGYAREMQSVLSEYPEYQFPRTTGISIKRRQSFWDYLFQD